MRLPDGTFFTVASDGNLSTDIVAYAEGVTGPISATIFEPFVVCTPFGTSTVPVGTWTVYSLVVPAGTDINALNWETDPYELTYYSFDISCE